jgi:hypothetical protein
MKFKIYHKNGKTKIINATDLNDAEKKADKIWKDWIDIKILKYVEHRKSITMNKRQHVKKSDKIYDRNKEKQKLKKELE